MKAFEYVTTETYESAAAFLARQPAGSTLVKAGGMDVLDRLKERIAEPDRLLNLRPLHDRVDTIKARPVEQLIIINTLTKLAEVATHEGVRKRLPALAQAAEHAATPQVRNVATVGGNLLQKPRCWYYRSAEFRCLKKGGGTCYAAVGDSRYHAIFGAGACHIVHPSNMAVPLLAYRATARLIKQDGDKLIERMVAFDDLFRVPPNPQHDEHVLEPSEILHEISIAIEDTGPRSAYVEVRAKQSFDWPLVSCAVNLNKPDQPRIVLGAVAPIPWRLPAVEQVIAGKSVSAELLTEAKKIAVRDAAPMAMNAYKLTLVPVVLERALKQAAEAR